MEEFSQSRKGYVYILEVADIELPVCKIGMTTRTPNERCQEINSSSTGDFIWSVAHYIAVDDCRKLESLVHSKLAPLRQRKREFFNLSAENAFTALLSIFDGQTEIKRLSEEEVEPPRDEKPNKRNSRKNRTFSPIDSEYTEVLQLFTSLLGVKGRPFGQLNKPGFGISDGAQGVQWNLSVSTDTGMVGVGVNLEGIKYTNWPISKLVLSELENPRIFQIIREMENPNDTYISFTRDAWQVTSRPDIVEKYIGGQELKCSDLSSEQWEKTLYEALECLNEKTGYQGRAKQTVTLAKPPRKGSQVRLMDVSPHLRIWSPLNMSGNIESNLSRKIKELRPVYDWANQVCGSR